MNRLKRLEEMMAKAGARKTDIESQLGDPAVYASEEKVKVLLEDRAYVARELDALEGEWLQKQAELEWLP